MKKKMKTTHNTKTNFYSDTTIQIRLKNARLPIYNKSNILSNINKKF